MKEKLRSLSLPTRVIAAIYLGSTLTGLILFWTGVDRLGWLYMLGFMLRLLPAEIFLSAIWVGVRDIPTKKKLLSILVFGAAYILSLIGLEPATIWSPESYPTVLIFFFRAVLCSAAGVGVGLGIKRLVRAIRERKKGTLP